MQARLAKAGLAFLSYARIISVSDFGLPLHFDNKISSLCRIDWRDQSAVADLRFPSNHNAAFVAKIILGALLSFTGISCGSAIPETAANAS